MKNLLTKTLFISLLSSAVMPFAIQARRVTAADVAKSALWEEGLEAMAQAATAGREEIEEAVAAGKMKKLVQKINNKVEGNQQEQNSKSGLTDIVRRLLGFRAEPNYPNSYR